MKKKKRTGFKRFLRFICIQVLILFIIFFVYDNLHTYSPYYAKQLNKDGEHREVMFLVKDLLYVDKPNSDDYFYDYDGGNMIENSVYGISRGNSYNQSILVYQSDNIKEDYIFAFNQKLELLKILHNEGGLVYEPVTKEIEERAKNQLLEDIQPIMDIQKRPIINLQWMFNLFYGEWHLFDF